MFASIRRHQKWLWFVISILTIISFVGFLSPRSTRGLGRGAWMAKDTIGSIYGHDVSREGYQEAQREAALSYYLRSGQWPADNEAVRQLGILERETRERLLFGEKLKQLDVQVSEGAVAQWIFDVFQDPNRHVFNKDRYEQFVRQELPGRIGMNQRDFERFVRHQVGIQHLFAIFGLGGKLVTPQEAEAAYRRENEQVDTKIILISSSNYFSKVNLDHGEIARFYTNNQANYRIPERIQISYVKFDVTNF